MAVAVRFPMILAFAACALLLAVPNVWAQPSIDRISCLDDNGRPYATIPNDGRPCPADPNARTSGGGSIPDDEIAFIVVGSVLVLGALAGVGISARSKAAKASAPPPSTPAAPETAWGTFQGIPGQRTAADQAYVDSYAQQFSRQPAWSATPPRPVPPTSDALDAAVSENPAAKAVAEVSRDFWDNVSSNVTALATGAPLEEPDLLSMSNQMLRGFLDAGKGNLEKITGNPMGGKTYELGMKAFEHTGYEGSTHLPSGDQFVDGIDHFGHRVLHEHFVKPLEEAFGQVKQGAVDMLRDSLVSSDPMGYHSTGSILRTNYWAHLGPR